MNECIVKLITSDIADAPGLYRMTEAAYHGDPCPTPSLSRSIAEKLVLKSPGHAFAAHPRLTKPDEEDHEEEKNSRTRDIGSAAHAMLLRQPTEIAVLDYKTFQSKAAKEDRDAAQERGAIPLLKKDHKTVLAMVDKARTKLAKNKHAAIRAIVEGDDSAAYNEVTAVWQDPCGKKWARARMDRLHLTSSLATIIDYKTTELSVEPAAVARAIYNNGYHFQDGFYRRGARNVFPAIDRHEMRLDFRFILQEQNPPYEISVAYVSPAGRLQGEKMVSDAFMMWRKCCDENWWPGYPEDDVEADLPPYVETAWNAREIEHPYLQGLGFDPMPMYETQPYKPKQIVEPI